MNQKSMDVILSETQCSEESQEMFRFAQHDNLGIRAGSLLKIVKRSRWRNTR
jgi:hypothetical protein